MKKVFVLMWNDLNEPAGTVEGLDGPMFDTYATEREAQLEIIDVMEEYMRQFKEGTEGERPFWDCVNSQMCVCEAKVSEDGRRLEVFDMAFTIGEDGNINEVKS